MYPLHISAAACLILTQVSWDPWSIWHYSPDTVRNSTDAIPWEASRLAQIAAR